MTLLSRACVKYFIESTVCLYIVPFRVKEWRDLETGDTSRSRSLKMPPFDTSYATFYWSAIVSIAVCCIIFKVTEGHSNWHHSKAWVQFLFAFDSNYGRIFNRL